MTVDVTQSMQQTQMKKMDGSGGQGGGNGMKSVMENLSSEDRVAVQEQMSALSQEERVDMKDQLKAIDATGMSGDDYMQALMDILDSQTTEESDTFTAIYA